MHLSERDVVRVIAEVPENRAVDCARHGRMPRPGDTGVVVMIYPASEDKEYAYAVESIDDAGDIVWIADMLGSELELVTPGTAGP